MAKKKNICLITSCIDFAILLLIISAIVFFIAMFSGSGEVFREAQSMTEGADPKLDTYGYNLLGSIGIGTIGAVGVVVAVASIAGLSLAGMVLLPCIVYGLITWVKAKKYKIYKFKTDNIIKLVSNGIIAFVCISSTTLTQPWWIVISLLPVSVVVMCIVSFFLKDEANVE